MGQLFMTLPSFFGHGLVPKFNECTVDHKPYPFDNVLDCRKLERDTMLDEKEKEDSVCSD